MESTNFALRQNCPQKTRVRLSANFGKYEFCLAAKLPAKKRGWSVSRIFAGWWWMWRSWLARKIVALEVAGSNPVIHLLPGNGLRADKAHPQ